MRLGILLSELMREWLDKHGYEPPADRLSLDWTDKMGPQPEPWTVARQFVRAVQAKDLAMRLPDGDARQALLRSSSLSIAHVLDDCGTPSLRWPWPWPGPPPWVWQIAAALSSYASALAPGSFREEILGLAGRVITHAAEAKVG